MARPLRIEFPGALYHVTARGNARSVIFLRDGDRFLFPQKKEQDTSKNKTPIPKQFIDQHGGQIWVESEPGKGTTVFFTLPVSN